MTLAGRIGTIALAVLLLPAAAPSAATGGTRCGAGKPTTHCRPARPRKSARHPMTASIPVPRPKPMPPQEPAPTRQQGASDDLSEAREVPDNIRKIIADPRIEPVIAYVLRQAAHKPIGDWTVRQLQQVAAVISTLPETGIPMAEIQTLYEFLGLDPGDVFNPQLGSNWQDSSTRFDRSGGGAVAAISSADCQGDPGEMTVSVSRSCQSGDAQQ